MKPQQLLVIDFKVIDQFLENPIREKSFVVNKDMCWTCWEYFKDTWSSLSNEVVTKEEQERWASILSLCVALPSWSTAPFISLLKDIFVKMNEYCHESPVMPIWSWDPLVRSLIPVCTGPESAFLTRPRRCALTAASQADANVNSFQQMPLGKLSTNINWGNFVHEGPFNPCKSTAL